MRASWDEMRAVDVRPYCYEREGYLYLNWARCIDLLHKYGVERVYFLPIPNPENGTSLYCTGQEFKDKSGNINRCYETRIKVVIDDEVFEMQSPVMNGTNPVKDNSMSQQRVWNSMTRSFVKCVAIQTGLGFDLWLKEEERPSQTPPMVEDAKASQSELTTIKKVCEKHGVNLDLWLNRNGVSTLDELTGGQAGLMLRALNEKFGD